MQEVSKFCKIFDKFVCVNVFVSVKTELKWQNCMVLQD